MFWLKSSYKETKCTKITVNCAKMGVQSHILRSKKVSNQEHHSREAKTLFLSNYQQGSYSNPPIIFFVSLGIWVRCSGVLLHINCTHQWNLSCLTNVINTVMKSISISYKKITAIFRTILTLLSLKIAEQMIQVLAVSMSSRIHPSSFK